MNILALETSCDDTAAAVLDCQKNKLLANVVASQAKLHQQFGGVYPTMAKREHEHNLVAVVAKTLKIAQLGKRSRANFTKLSATQFKQIKRVIRSWRPRCLLFWPKPPNQKLALLPSPPGLVWNHVCGLGLT